MIEAVQDELVGGFDLLLGERNLFEVIFAVVRVVLERVLQVLFFLTEHSIFAHSIGDKAIASSHLAALETTSIA